MRRFRLRKRLRTGRVVARPVSFSVVICTYLREESLRNVLLDITAQHLQPNEVIVIDQSPQHEPATDALLRELAPLVRHERQQEPNLPAARNRGVQFARGDVVLFVDDDVRLSPSFLGDVCALFRTAEVDALAPLVVGDGERPRADDATRHSPRGGLMDRRLLAVDSAIGACMAIRRDAINAVGGFDAALGRLHPSASGEDLEFTRRLTRAGFVLAEAPGIRVTHETDRPGGCRNREAGNFGASRQALAYIALKEGNALDRLTPAVIARLARIYVVRRDVIVSSSRLWEGLRALISDVSAARRVTATGARSDGGPEPGAPGGRGQEWPAAPGATSAARPDADGAGPDEGTGAHRWGPSTARPALRRRPPIP